MLSYSFALANASLTLRVIEYLRQTRPFTSACLTVIHQINGWIIRIKLKRPLNARKQGDFLAFLHELGISYPLDNRLQMAFWCLDAGDSPVAVMRNYQLAIISHGLPAQADIEAFRQSFVEGLGYCPETLA
ncbi:MAG: hypothetical protein ACRC6M_02555 [Microcystaceae cyanobacterium]